MKCTRCSAEIPSQSQFCLRCGASVRGTSPQSGSLPSQPFSTPPASNNRTLYAIIGVLALAVLGIGGFAFSKMLQKPGNAASSGLVQAPATGMGSPLVQAPGNGAPAPLVQAPSGAPAPKPTDVNDYLAWLKRIEASKQQIIRTEFNEVQALFGTITAAQIKQYMHFDEGGQGQGNNEGNDGGQLAAKITQVTERYAREWNSLTEEFNKRTPPSSCNDLHLKYYDQLGKIQGQLIQLFSILGKVASDPQNALTEVQNMRGSASSDVDSAVRIADSALTEVCNRYNITKDFEIKSDPNGVSNILGGLSM